MLAASEFDILWTCRAVGDVLREPLFGEVARWECLLSVHANYHPTILIVIERQAVPDSAASYPVGALIIVFLSVH